MKYKEFLKKYWKELIGVVLVAFLVFAWIYRPIEPRRKYEKEKQKNIELERRLEKASKEINTLMSARDSLNVALNTYRDDLYETTYGLLREYASSEDEANRIISRNIPNLVNWYTAMRDSAELDRARLSNLANAFRDSTRVLGQ